MTKICIIGNSHIGPLRYPVASEKFPKSVRLTFFGAHSSLIGGLKLNGRALVASGPELREKLQSLSGGKGQINLDDYDRFMVIGHGFWIGAGLHNYEKFVCDSMRGPVEGKYLISDACFLAFYEQAILNNQAFRIAGLIRSVCDKPITVIPGPNPGLGLSEEELRRWNASYFEIAENGDDEVVAGFFRQACDRIAKAERLTIIPPLREAAANGLFNLREYTQLPDNLDAHEDYNFRLHTMTHGNGRYGVHLARHVFGDAYEVQAAQ